MEDGMKRDRTRIGMGLRVTSFVLAVICIGAGQAWEAWHPLELAMDLLAPTSFLLLATAPSLESWVAKASFGSSLVLILVMVLAAAYLPGPSPEAP